jgi:orotidine-5'-phosphate decarboxylase
LDIYSPGIGTQGGKTAKVLDAGSDFLIIGRTILNAKNPASLAEKFQKLSFLK